MKSISLKISIGYFTILLISLIIASFLFSMATEVKTGVSLFVEKTLPELNTIKNISNNVQKMQLSTFSLYGTTLKAADFKRQHAINTKELTALFQQLPQHNASNLSSIKNNIKQIDNHSQDLLTEMSSGKTDWDKARSHITKISSQSNQAQANIKTLKQDIESNAKALSQNMLAQVQQTRFLIIVLVVAIILVTIFFYLLSQKIIASPINKLSNSLKIATDNSDLSTSVDETSSDEVGQTAHNINNLFSSFRLSLSHVFSASNNISSSIGTLQSSADLSYEHTLALNNKTSQVINEMNQLELEIIEGTERSKLTAQSAKINANDVESGSNIVDKTAESIKLLSDELNNSAQMLLNLRTAGEEISGVVGTIEQIAEQTNLLALNAAIEAARAGESGRGFAVVADEVRLLATRTSTSTQEIQKMLDKLMSIILESVKSMENNSQDANESVNLAIQTVEVLSTIKVNILQLSEESNSVANLSENSKNKVIKMKDEINGFHLIGEQINKSSSTVVNTAESLNNLAQQLQSQVNQFKL